MPLYEYRCCACGHEFERIVSLCQANKIIFCPQCDEKATKQISAPNFKINGYSEANGYSKKLDKGRP